MNEKIISNDRFSMRTRVETIILQGKDFIVFVSTIYYFFRKVFLCVHKNGFVSL